jgi:hypothetical protein
MTAEGTKETLPAAVARTVGRGRVVYFAAAIDAALWSYAYPYQRRLLVRALEWAARTPAPVTIAAPMCVQATHFVQEEGDSQRVVIHLFNGVNTTANHGLPGMDVPLREEVIPIHGIEVRFADNAPRSFHVEPGNRAVRARKEGTVTIIEVPSLEVHAMLVGEY